jgi:hypothetical protein
MNSEIRGANQRSAWLARFRYNSANRLNSRLYIISYEMAKVQSMSKSGSHRKLEKSRLDPNPGSTLSGGVGFQPLPIDSGSVATLKTVTEDTPSGAGRRGFRRPDRTAGR